MSDEMQEVTRRDLLRKSVQSATALSEYYSAIEKKIPPAEGAAENLSQLSEKRISEAISKVSTYLREQRDHYAQRASPLSNTQKALMWPYFSASLLDRVRIIELRGKRIPNPPFYAEARALGFANLPEWTHMHSLTFLDVIIFNESLTDRSLFHGLVHAVQFVVLGLERYTALFVRSFIHTRLQFSVPLEAHTFSLESRFVGNPAHRFSVEEQVRLWVQQGRSSGHELDIPEAALPDSGPSPARSPGGGRRSET